MSQADKIYQKILKDIKVELTEEFDRNFERKAFFTDPAWQPTKLNNKRGSLMMRTGTLRNSIHSELTTDGVKFSSAVPYANLHNEGGTLKVTPQMKKFFWAKYYLAYGSVSYSIKTKQPNNTKRNKMLNEEATYWRNMALMKVGTVLTIPERRFIGDHPQVQVLVKQVVDDNMKNLEQYIYNLLKQK